MAAVDVVSLAIDVATRRRDDAGRNVGLAHRNRSNAKDQLEQLESYGADTDARWALSSQAVSSPEIVLHYYQFMDRLQQAIVLQRRVVGDLEREVQDAQQLLLEAEIRVASLNRLMKRKEAGLRKLQEGREQRQMDQLAASQHRRLLVETESSKAP